MSKRTGNEGLRLAQSHFNRMDLGGTAPTANERLALSTLMHTLDASIGISTFKVLYPLIGSAAAPHALDVIGGHDITWTGGITHDADGVLSNGSTGYGDMGFNPTDAGMSDESGHMAAYVEGTESGGSALIMGVDTPAFTFVGWVSSGTKEGGQWGGTSGQYAAAAPSTSGMHVLTRTGSILTRMFVNGTQRGSDQTDAATNLPNEDFYLLCYNGGGGTPAPAGFCNRPVKFASVGDGLSDAQATILHDAVVAFQTTLGRQI